MNKICALCKTSGPADSLQMLEGQLVCEKCARKIQAPPTGSVDIPQYEFPVRANIIPRELGARVHYHEVDTAEGRQPCWTYVSEGLAAFRQKEVVFSLLSLPGESPDEFPHTPFVFFKQICELAKKGQLTHEGYFTQFGQGQFLGRDGVGYIPAESFAEVDIPYPALAAVLLTNEEIEAAKEWGSLTRVVSRLGKTYGYYPCPRWSDRERPGLPMKDAIDKSIITKMNRFGLADSTVVLQEDEIVLSLIWGTASRIQERLGKFPADEPLALLTGFDPAANGCLVWEPGQNHPSAITPPDSSGSKLSGTFIGFVPGQDKDGGRVVEDGMVMMLTYESWGAVRQAILNKENISIPGENGNKNFSIKWINLPSSN